MNARMYSRLCLQSWLQWCLAILRVSAVVMAEADMALATVVEASVIAIPFQDNVAVTVMAEIAMVGAQVGVG